MSNYATPHGDKLRALVANGKIPRDDLPRVTEQIARYEQWISTMNSLEEEGDELVDRLTQLLNEYKFSVEFNLIFCSENDFLHRQKGQLKLDNTILEEFLPRLFDSRIVPGLLGKEDFDCGPKASFAGLSFNGPFLSLGAGGAYLKRKDQDFSVTRKHVITISRPDSPAESFSEEFHVSYFASEIKTNLDKTMFQEAAATAAELKKSTTGSKYILLCEWLDMTPISTSLTAIDEVIVLRKAKRVGSQVRKNFSDHAGRLANKTWYEKHLRDNPISPDCMKRFAAHLQECFPEDDGQQEDVILDRGFF